MKHTSSIPKYNFNRITDIGINDLKSMGAEAIAIDLDNTTVKDASMHLSSPVREWINKVIEAGFKVIIISNTFEMRAKLISEKMGGIPYIAGAHKPHTTCLRKAAEIINVDLSKLAMIGDQLFTDVKAANKAGAISVKVEPMGKERFLKSHWKKVRNREKEYLAETAED